MSRSYFYRANINGISGCKASELPCSKSNNSVVVASTRARAKRQGPPA